VSVGGKARKYFLLAYKARNHLKILDSDERIQENPRKSKAQIQAKKAKLRRKQSASKDFQIPGPAPAASLRALGTSISICG
jgi:hypothetical protein